MLFLTPDTPVASVSVAPFSIALVIGDAVILPGPGVRQMLPVLCDGKVGWAVVMWMRRCETVTSNGVCWDT